ncbi:hypothetical protein F4553_004711 [Allocatelliglobosispora scoriae]|uniref:Uncharacterized protein n=1 Tax=Allocatelliglobosispora scoriae TaxID=643052 RepID=A0A841BX39_9ACTN|nr:hypothetical protein [Allocatelliglobosispora scoriae]MBB5871332.1 hypothetical protein [Allocatelliglobosispora scoriae]
MDALDRVNLAAADLLRRVDEALSGGAPAGHRVWPLLRWIRVLPGPAVEAIVGLRPPDAEDAREVETLAVRVAEAAEPLATQVAWEGSAGAAFETQRRAYREHLVDSVDSVTVRLEDFASYLEELGAWIAESRVALALRLATVLRSQESVTLLTSLDAAERGLAAAEIGAEVLAEIEEILRAGEEVEADWQPRLARLRRGAWRPDLSGPAAPTTLRLDL